jgi:hypothetical protein
MAYLTGDIVRIAIEQTYVAQQGLNVYFYQLVVDDSAMDALDIIRAFNLEMTTKLRVLLRSDVTIGRIRLDNISNGLDFGEVFLNQAGTNPGAGNMPPFVAAQVKLVTATKETRAGYKRYWGLSEGDVAGESVGGSWTAGAGTSFVAEHAVTQNIVDDDASAMGTMTPVVVGRFPTGAYDLTRVQPITNATLFPLVTTQVSRRRGHGN